jgi:thiol-disulfide isomerase/thioredoxin
MKRALKLATMLALATVSASLMSVHAEPAAAADPSAKGLRIGDPAPDFKVTDWYKGDAVTMDAEKTYIIECWATWCGPCIAVFPHLSEIALANKDKITVIGVNVWEKKKPEEVKAFVEGQGDKMSYLVAADGEGVIARDWLKAAGQNGIPSAFIVHKGKVNWIGHPAAMNQDLLDSIIAGTYDVEAAAKVKEKQRAADQYFKTNVAPLMMKKEYAVAIEKLEEMKKEYPDNSATIDRHINRLKTLMAK